MHADEVVASKPDEVAAPGEGDDATSCAEALEPTAAGGAAKAEPGSPAGVLHHALKRHVHYTCSHTPACLSW